MHVFDGLLHVHYRQAYVVSGDGSEMDASFSGQTNGLIGAGQQGMLVLHTGLHTGFVELTVDVADHEPQPDEAWEECVEASFLPIAADVRLIEWGGETVCDLPLQSRHYRVRYAARGMDAGHAADTVLDGEEPVDAYRLWFWPSPPAVDRVIRQTSETARYWHNWARGS